MQVTLVDASRTNRSFTAAAPARRKVPVDPWLLFWRKLIDLAVADAKRTRRGLPTDSALLARWWIEENKPAESDKFNYERSFVCACKWLDCEAAAERARVLAIVDASLDAQLRAYARDAIYVRRAAVLSCAGMPTAIARQFQLSLVSSGDYEHVAGVEHPDPPGTMLLDFERKTPARHTKSRIRAKVPDMRHPLPVAPAGTYDLVAIG